MTGIERDPLDKGARRGVRRTSPCCTRDTYVRECGSEDDGGEGWCFGPRDPLNKTSLLLQYRQRKRSYFFWGESSLCRRRQDKEKRNSDPCAPTVVGTTPPPPRRIGNRRGGVGTRSNRCDSGVGTRRLSQDFGDEDRRSDKGNGWVFRRQWFHCRSRIETPFVPPPRDASSPYQLPILKPLYS